MTNSRSVDDYFIPTRQGRFLSETTDKAHSLLPVQLFQNNLLLLFRDWLFVTQGTRSIAGIFTGVTQRDRAWLRCSVGFFINRNTHMNWDPAQNLTLTRLTVWFAKICNRVWPKIPDTSELWAAIKQKCSINAIQNAVTKFPPFQWLMTLSFRMTVASTTRSSADADKPARRV